eukprot:scaffold29020_cov21-Cyclotella_meneghiniana.AAC.2
MKKVESRKSKAKGESIGVDLCLVMDKGSSSISTINITHHQPSKFEALHKGHQPPWPNRPPKP